MREQTKYNHPGKAQKYPRNPPCKVAATWAHQNRIHSARSLDNIVRHPHTSSGQNNSHLKRNYSLRIVRKLSRLVSGGGENSFPCAESDSATLLLQEPVAVHLPKRSSSCSGEDSSARRVVSRRQILSSLREEEEESFSLLGMEYSLPRQADQRPCPGHQDQGIRETRSLERFLPGICYPNQLIEDRCTSSSGSFHIPRSKPRTIYSRSDFEGSPTTSVTRFSMSLSCELDPAGGEGAGCMQWTGRRRTRSISCSPEWSSQMSEPSTWNGSYGSSLSLNNGSSHGQRFSRYLLLQSISKEEIRDPSDCESSAEELMSPSSPCSHQSVDENDNSAFEEASDEEIEKLSNNKNDFLPAVTNNNCDINYSSTNKNFYASPESVSVDKLELDMLHWVGTLGIGGFGRVELVTAGINNNQTFALKKMKKIEIQEEKHQQHILNEKHIMLSCSSPFIVKLFRTFRDSRYLYMLMEPCLGGELWTILRDKKKFDDSSARFYTACVIKAFEYLHSKGIVYRDLKPENLLLDSTGYVKLTDFGFSKQLEEGEKSWTFCGTPEYVAPEMITNKAGHDQRADIWSVGILMYELLNGVPPFSKVRNNSDGNTRNNVYTEILKGMKSVYFPPHMSSTAVELIRQLCRLNPAQRPSLAVTRRFMWFAGMDWQGLENRTLSPPFLPKIQGAMDTSNFDNYGKDCDQPEEDFSDWDLNF